MRRQPFLLSNTVANASVETLALRVHRERHTSNDSRFLEENFASPPGSEYSMILYFGMDRSNSKVRD